MKQSDKETVKSGSDTLRRGGEGVPRESSLHWNWERMWTTLASVIILLIISYICGEARQSFSTMDSGRVLAGKPVRCPWCWTERGSSSSLQQSRRTSAPADMCTLAPLPEFPPGRQYTYIFFIIHVSPCARITFSYGPQGPRGKKRQLLQWFATQFMVLLRRRGKWTE